MNNLQFKYFIILMLLCTSPSLFAQAITESGTIIAVFYLEDRILVAAESRQVIDGTPIAANSDNRACKIVRLGDHAFFAASGLVSLHGEAQIVKKAFCDVPSGDITKIAEQWANLKIRLYKEIASHDPEKIKPSDQVITGVFGTNAHGRPESYVVFISLTLKPDSENPGRPTFVFAQKPSGPFYYENKQYFLAYGSDDKELLHEFSDHKIQRAQEAFDETFKGTRRDISVDEQHVVAVEATMKYAVRFGDPDRVGLPIDILDLPKSGSSVWRRIKPECDACNQHQTR